MEGEREEKFTKERGGEFGKERERKGKGKGKGRERENYQEVQERKGKSLVRKEKGKEKGGSIYIKRKREEKIERVRQEEE